VERVVVGTHSFEIDRQLVCLFAKSDWNLEGSTLAGGPNSEGDRLLSITVFRFGETIDSKASY
jgi:hypothetical protein